MLKLRSGMVWLGAASGVALLAGGANSSYAQSSLPAVTIEAPQQAARQAKPQRRSIQAQRSPRRVAASTPAPAGTTTQPQNNAGAGGERANGPVVGYAATRSATGTKTDTPILMTPQSISVVTQDQIRDQGAQNINQALRYTPGITLDPYGTTTFYETFKLRGFDAPRYLDGLRLPVDPGSQFAFPKIEPYGLERIEVLKGPSSGLYGQTDPGGFLNMISKRPLAQSQNEISATIGSFGRLQTNFDLTGPLDKSGEVLYRLVGVARNADSQTNYVTDDKVFIAPSLTWRPTADTNFTVLGHYQKVDNDGYQQYMPGGVTLLPNPFGRVSYSSYFGEPGRDHTKLEQGAVGYSLDHRFNNVFSFGSNVRYMEVSQDLAGVRVEGGLGSPPTATGVGADFRSVSRSYNYVVSSARNLTADNHLQADFMTGPLSHKVLVGVDYFNLTGKSDYRFASIAPIDAFAPVYGTKLPPASTLSPFIKTDNTLKQTGIYLQDQIALDRFTLTLTGRRDHAEAETVSSGIYPPSGTTSQNDYANTGRVGLNYLFDSGLSPYASYATSFTPTSGSDRLGTAFRPVTGESKEVGLKYQPTGTNLLLTAALFEINQKNVLTTDPVNVLFSVQTGEVRVRGFEFEARGNLTRELQIVGGYTHLEPVVTSSNTGNVGLDVVNVARDTAALWAKYTWFTGTLAGFGIGGGARYVGETYGNAMNTLVVPSYTLFDAAASYDFAYLRPDMKGLSLQVSATNLANKFYMTSCQSSAAYCGAGAARTVLATIRYQWN
ncbi:TonB-dependent siderophore receptor [Rhodopseudomonas sp.]|uniref:TonB-dependent siderophore receptor n=1 Tax=Rhodopseudomonas sp. TaxID=1078 RepID=UPI0039E5F102